MASEVEYTDEFGAWWEGLDEDEQESIYTAVILCSSSRWPTACTTDTSKP